MDPLLAKSRSGRFFLRVTARPLLVLVATAAVLLALAGGLTRLGKDSSNMANIHPLHPARVATERVEEIFGLSDDGSMVMVVVDDAPGGVFDAETLALVHWLTERIRELPGVDPDEVTSLATENDIIGTDWGMEVRRFFEEPPATPETAAAVRDAVLDFELYVDGLVARDGRATRIVLELLDGADDTAVYWRLRELAARAPVGPEALHVAGIGAFNARIGEYVEADAQRLNAVAGLVILMMLAVAYRTVRGVLLPASAMVGAVVAAFGAMGALGIPVYTLTNSVSVILIAIGVCDGIHVMGQYYAELARRPRASGRELAVRSMVEMWRPVAVTSFTTMAGFLVISATTNVPPMQSYGVFASIGVLAALAVCVFAIPAALALLPPRPSPAFRRADVSGAPRADVPGAPRADVPGAPRADVFARLTSRVGLAVTRRPRASLGATAAAGLLALAGATRLEIDNSATNYLQESEPLHVAIDETNRTLGGIWNLDILVEAAEPGALYRPENLRRIEALQERVEGLPGVKSSRSIVEYVKQMHRAMHGDDPDFYAIPDDADLIAQYFLVYSASAGPTDLEEVVDYDFRRANVRAALDVERSSLSSRVVRGLKGHLHNGWDGGNLRVSLAGWANLGHQWSLDIARSQWLGVPAALLAVGAVTAICFRSALAGALSLVPASLAVLLVYAVMGALGIWMDFANSVLAALAVGVTVDFAVHTLDRLIELARHRRFSLERAFAELFPSTGRALLFNFAAIALGFGVLVSSQIPPLRRFGVLVVVCVTASALASLSVLPALVRVLRPRFLAPAPRVSVSGRRRSSSPPRAAPLP